LQSQSSLVAPQGTSTSVVKILDEAIRKALAEPAFVSLAEKTENTIDYKGPEAFAAELRQLFKANGELLRILAIKNE
jgi:tripartite-type tricarboxylate transporter receptor subunit TctC